MSYYETLLQYKDFAFEKTFAAVSTENIQRAIFGDKCGIKDFLSLLSPLAESHLEEMAERAQAITLRYFGKTIQLYTPLYLSNYCDNSCLYCGFNADNNIERKKLLPEEVEKEAEFIAASGLKHILLLTGESRKESPLSYLLDSVRIAKKYFSSIHIEVYPLLEEEYRQLLSEGVDGLTIYQEAYDQALYERVHPAGPKKDYRFRLEAAERGAQAGMRCVNIGALLGLGEWRKEIFACGLHAKYLQDKFPEVEIGISIPRVRQQVSDFKPLHPLCDTNLVQIVLALRIFLPRLGIALSTREKPALRDNLVLLGVTRMSAGSTTAVGGHTQKTLAQTNSAQFQIQDERSVEDIKAMLESKGYQPVLKDWMHF